MPGGLELSMVISFFRRPNGSISGDQIRIGMGSNSDWEYTKRDLSHAEGIVSACLKPIFVSKLFIPLQQSADGKK